MLDKEHQLARVLCRTMSLILSGIQQQLLIAATKPALRLWKHVTQKICWHYWYNSEL